MVQDQRPDPDALLEQERAANRGRLKVYLGMAAGVGKTYSMLSDARIEQQRGIDVVLGYLEPHGRSETDVLGGNFEVIPLRGIDYKGIQLKELDLDRILERKPHTVIIDELPHTNAPGSRHAKRWQDIEEILSAGIAVVTTLNVQHLESLQEVVSNITGVAVQETVPDSFLAKADEVELVDVTPEELLQRLEAGKIYKPDKIDAALKNFFQKGHLIALRELVLRRTADTVDVQLKTLRRAQGVQTVWPTNPRVLVAVGPTKFAAKLVRAAARLAFNLRAELVAVNVSALSEMNGSPSGRSLASSALSLAESLGAETVQTAANDIVSELIRVARDKNANVIVIGKPLGFRVREYLFGSPVDALIRKSGDIDVYVVRAEKEDADVAKYTGKKKPLRKRSVFATLTTLAATTGVCFLMYPRFELSNLIMVYLLGTAWVAANYGRLEAGIAALGSVLLFDFCFVPPRWTFSVADAQYLVTFAVMFTIGMLISTLTIRRREQALVVIERERRTSALYELTRHLAVARSINDVGAAASRQISLLLHIDSALFVLKDYNRLESFGAHPLKVDQEEMGVALWVSQHQKNAGKGTDTLPGASGTYFPVTSGKAPCSVLGVYPLSPLERDQFELLEAISHLLATSIERIEREGEAHSERLRAEREELRNLLLSSISHDLRTPLAAIAGSASVVLTDSSLSRESKELVSDISSEALRLGIIVRNILDLTRLESGHVELQLEWHSVEELVGAALERTSTLLGARKIESEIPGDLPLIEVDGFLIEQLLINIFENIARHTSEATQVEIRARAEVQDVVIEVLDDGPGLPEGKEALIFERLVSMNKTGGGTGLGLTICRAIAEVHGGSISAINRPNGGACFIIRLLRSKSQPEVVHD